MTATDEPRPWDFSHVLDLVNSLSFQHSPSEHKTDDEPNMHNDSGRQAAGRLADVDRRDFACQDSTLGDFSRIFQYLGTPVTLPAPAVQAPQLVQPSSAIFTTKTDYTSDGAAQATPAVHSRRTVRWQIDSDTEEQGGEAVSDSSVLPDSPTLTKSQRKKRNRRERKAKEVAQAGKRGLKSGPAYVSESEADFVSRHNPAKKASLHSSDTAKQIYQLWGQDAPDHAPPTPDPLLEASRVARERMEAAKKANLEAFHGQANPTVAGHSLQTKPHISLTRHHSHSFTASVKDGLNGGPITPSAQPPKPTQSGNLSDTAALHFRPATVQPQHQTPQKAFAPSLNAHGQQSLPAKQHQIIQPMVVRSGEDRHWALLVKLIGDFYEDRKHLISPMNLTTHNNNPDGIHVFVDASNIFIGFKDQLKRSRGIPPWVQIPPVDLSFDALALLMERRRPVAKRVLAGSTPWEPPFDKAKAVGYECSILEKVYKARELTERQIYFKENDKYGRHGLRKSAKAPPANDVAGGPVSGNGSGSETNAPQYAPARMIEQGVDEILHLKILESVVDAEKPSTIVLATGDAAQAEYSQGFMAMTERALKKGWTVELVSWSKNISAMYTRKEWRDAWGERFKIVTLDDYAEELLDM